MGSKTESKNKGTFQPDSDVHITIDDQMKINKFANYNAKVEDLKEELKIKQNELKNLEEAGDEIELLDEETPIPFLIGEVFISHDLPRTQELLAEVKEKKKIEIENIQKLSKEIQEKMSELKAHLYGRFGSNIYLENDE
ncbi:probable prefoldin subunit 4 [Malaya genurostris]|uniref:probable prefoldin subunit 4 n=1 Tax=Malaya genurostris TaxID=325434 RepID=UPI0026F3B4A9|nr:probable prefoldin subunit 4 [Malaya genurostris]